MPELVLSPSLDLTPWSGETTSASIYESPMSPTVVRVVHNKAAAFDASAAPPAAASEPSKFPAPVRPAPAERSTDERSVGLATGLTITKLRMLQSTWRSRSTP